MAEDLLLYVGQKAFIEKDGQVLILIAPFGLDLPGGKIQEGETDFALALKREVQEETRLDIEIGAAFATWSVQIRKGYKNEGKLIYLVGFKCKYKAGNTVISNEHSNYKWINKDNFQELYEDTMTFRALEIYFKGQ